MATDPETAIPRQSPQTDDNSGDHGYFPRRYITDFFKFIKDNATDLQVITYADLPWSGDIEYRNNYSAEHRAWKKAVRSGQIDRNKAYVLIQYDVDTRPDRTMDLLRAPEHRDVPANIMIFNRRIDRRRLKTTGELAFTDYPLDDDYLKNLEREGFLIGYHTNAMEQGLFDIKRAHKFFDADVRALRERFNLDFFSAHGGVTGANGLRNRDLPLHPDWLEKIRWVHNGHTVRFKRGFSDGGHNAKRLDPKDRDLRDFVRQFRPGHRYRIIIHPQYYCEKPKVSKSYGGTKWYDDMLVAAQAPETSSLWDGVKLGSAPNETRSLKQRLSALAWSLLRHRPGA